MEKLGTVCIDTDIIIDYLKGNEYKNILSYMIDKYMCKITPITVYELYYGGFYSGKVKPVETVISFLSLMQWTEVASKESARIHVELVKAKTPLEIRDILIAGICCAENIPLITRNIKHFQRIKRLKLVNVPKEGEWR